CHQYNFSPFTF
nr:immunoglobulin light chain junction region [Macaca mulatta]MOV75366.1 immunoglobulin light chain junction region [Macaca mulatta]